MSNNSIFLESKNPQSLQVIIDNLFKSDERIFIDESISYTALLYYAKKYDNNVITTLYNNKETRQQFFKKISDTHIFYYEKLDTFVNSSLIKNSYTKYKNQIGLFVKDNSDVVLNFPFKDCYLQGGQTEDEAKREEIFFNEVIAYDEIDMLLSEKAFCNFAKYTKNGKEDFSGFNRDENGTIKDNLLIKGNNLLALHSLKHEFKGKVKLIYIDPPYNTSGDANTFAYNNTFNHSSWLVFMKNRLEIAKEMLKKDGFISIAIDHAELFYLGVLADEVFGVKNKVGLVTVLHNPKGRNLAKFFSANSEFMLVYAKNIEESEFNSVAISDDVKASFNCTDNQGLFRYEPFLRSRTVWSRENKPNNWYPIYVSPNLSDITVDKKEGYYEIFPIANNGKEMAWKNIKSSFLELSQDNGYFIATKENNRVIIYHKFREQQVYKNVWTDKKYQSEFNGTNLLKSLLGSTSFSYPKSLYTVLDTIKLMSNEDSIILDFFGGSGTTAHAVLELNKEDGGNRQFILVEQMDYIESITSKRIEAVIKNNDFGEFVYFELAKFNEKCKELINKVTDSKQFKSLFDEIENKFFLSYEEDVEKFKKKLNDEESSFYKQTLEEQKIEFINKLDLNQMYVPKSECEDNIYELDSKDIKLTKDFYGEV